MERIRDESGDERADQRRDDPRAGHSREHRCPQVVRVGAADDGVDGREHCPGADAHKRAADEEHAHAAGEAADEAPDGEEHQRRVEHHPRRAPVDLAAGGNAGDDLRDEERVEHPSVEMLAIEITRQRRGDRGDGKALEGDEGDAEDRADRQGDDRCVPNGRRRP